MPAPLIWHITELTAWEAAVPRGLYRRSTRGRDLSETGFIHATLPEQISVVAKTLYPDRPEGLVILEIDVHRVEESGVLVSFEEDTIGATAQAYPHIHGPLPIAAVMRLRRTRWIGREFVVVA